MIRITAGFGRRPRIMVWLMAVALAGFTCPRSGLAQRLPQVGSELSPAEVQQLFDAFVLVQAQEALSLTDAQFGPFVSRLKHLQDVRRRTQQQEQRLLRTLQQLSSRASTSDEALDTRLQELDVQRTQAAGAVRNAHAAVEAILSTRQRVRFLAFERRMEQRQMELLMRARNARGGQTQPRRQRPNPAR
jgi:hypothetical protein